jgi:hypothetical protein
VFRDSQGLLSLLGAGDSSSTSSDSGNANGGGAEAGGGSRKSRLAAAVAELQRSVGATDLAQASVTLPRLASTSTGAATSTEAGAANFDTTALQSIRRPWAELERLYVQIN